VLEQELSDRTLLSCSAMHASPTPSILFVGGNRGIGMEGWEAVGIALSSKWNFKKLDLCE
jgi:hypothetical protein